MFLQRYLTPLDCVQQQNVQAFAVGKKDCSSRITAILNLAASARSGAISERCFKLLAQLASKVILPLCSYRTRLRTRVVSAALRSLVICFPWV